MECEHTKTHGNFALAPRTQFFLTTWASKCGTSFHFKNLNLPYFAILLDNNIMVAMQYLKTMMIFKNFCETKTFNDIGLTKQ